ncbi:hypothetical protein [Mycolicibacterium sp.]|uniref:hypothetical protein n=1 Tax=Mycolicibacterium sp. TaxID=2320850 RepID=UPI0037C6E3F5
MRNYDEQIGPKHLAAILRVIVIMWLLTIGTVGAVALDSPTGIYVVLGVSTVWALWAVLA